MKDNILPAVAQFIKRQVLHDRYCERKSSVPLKCMRCIVEGYSRRLANTADCHVILLKRVEQKNGGWQILTVCCNSEEEL